MRLSPQQSLNSEDESDFFQGTLGDWQTGRPLWQLLVKGSRIWAQIDRMHNISV